MERGIIPELTIGQFTAEMIEWINNYFASLHPDTPLASLPKSQQVCLEALKFSALELVTTLDVHLTFQSNGCGTSPASSGATSTPTLSQTSPLGSVSPRQTPQITALSDVSFQYWDASWEVPPTARCAVITRCAVGGS